MMRVDSKIKVYEVCGEDKYAKDNGMTVSSHWSLTDRVVIEVAGEQWTVLAADLRRAIDNAVNHK